MPLTYTAPPEYGGLKKYFGYVTLGNYATGGVSLGVPDAIPVGSILFVETENPNGYASYPVFSSSPVKVKFYSAPGTELANGSAALNGVVLRYVVYYRGV